jgi:hypothetical protein
VCVWGGGGRTPPTRQQIGKLLSQSAKLDWLKITTEETKIDFLNNWIQTEYWVIPEKIHTPPTEEISAVRRGRGEKIVSDNSKCIRTSEGGRGVNFQFPPWGWYGCFLEWPITEGIPRNWIFHKYTLSLSLWIWQTENTESFMWPHTQYEHLSDYRFIHDNTFYKYVTKYRRFCWPKRAQIPINEIGKI